MEASQVMVILRTMLSLGAVLALIYALSWFTKRYLRPGLLAEGAQKGIKVLYSVPIEHKKRLMVVEVGARQVLLGVADGSISYLCDVQGEPYVAKSA